MQQVKHCGCNRRVKKVCLLGNNCPNVLYEAKVKNDAFDEEKQYIGLEEDIFRHPVENHCRVFQYYQYHV